MAWRFFIGASILSCGLLFKAGAPVFAVALGVAAAGFLNWKKQHHGTRRPQPGMEKP